MSTRIGFIGAGKMATAMMEGIIAKGLCAKDDIIACCRTESTKKMVEEGIGVECFLDARPVFEGSDVIIIAVKPNQVKDILVTNIEAITTKKLIISVAAGVKISTLESMCQTVNSYVLCPMFAAQYSKELRVSLWAPMQQGRMPRS